MLTAPPGTAPGGRGASTDAALGSAPHPALKLSHGGGGAASGRSGEGSSEAGMPCVLRTRGGVRVARASGEWVPRGCSGEGLTLVQLGS